MKPRTAIPVADPDAQALLRKLQFTPETGEVHFLGHRMLLLHASSLDELRHELIDRLGSDITQELFMRMGYQQGFADALKIKELHGAEPLSRQLALGPRVREIEGFVKNQPIEHMELDPTNGAFRGDFFWEHSWEASAHLNHFGPSGAPSCWIMTGYASGYCTAITGVPIHWHEKECRAMGHARCRVIARPLTEWKDLAETEIAYLRTSQLTAGAAAGAVAPLRRKTPPLGKPPVASVQPPQAMNLPGFEDMVGTSPGFLAAAALTGRVAPTHATVLLNGETGTGKEGFARAVHRLSERRDAALVTVNCAAIPSELVEAELFGVERGAYTGATASREGRFERAHRGTLFLDEIASLPLAAQGKLLRALQQQEIERVGGTQLIKVDVRLIAAANRDLYQEVLAGRFREDLYYRLNVVPVQIPPLRERRSDILLLASVFMQRFQHQFNKHVHGLSPRASNLLLKYDWPGNVRELENTMERGIVLANPGGVVDTQHLLLPQEIGSSIGARSGAPAQETPEASPDTLVDALLSSTPRFEDIEHLVLCRTLALCKGNISATARALGLRRAQVEFRLKRHGLHTGKPSGGAPG
ncbi:sigma-54-dependent Fis family transcriptional regulator [Comamonas badia]|uniref:sigma-54-dependent Fis family transcriptional regulator n=1 Tax=Comamonas badia TaxID=265291 RepID=UPI00041E868D|nr:sigma-54-dependent Fis family transcriptional regulator [Comamonas badia]